MENRKDKTAVEERRETRKGLQQFDQATKERAK
jgi:hypothetical protein